MGQTLAAMRMVDGAPANHILTRLVVKIGGTVAVKIGRYTCAAECARVQESLPARRWIHEWENCVMLCVEVPERVVE